MRVLAILFLATCAAAFRVPVIEKFDHNMPVDDSQCPHTRRGVYECAVRYGDADHDCQISFDEIERLRETYMSDDLLGAWMGPAMRLASRARTHDLALECDADGDERISADELRNTETCLVSCNNAENIEEYICSVAQMLGEVLPPVSTEEHVVLCVSKA